MDSSWIIQSTPPVLDPYLLVFPQLPPDGAHRIANGHQDHYNDNTGSSCQMFHGGWGGRGLEGWISYPCRDYQQGTSTEVNSDNAITQKESFIPNSPLTIGRASNVHLIEGLLRGLLLLNRQWAACSVQPVRTWNVANSNHKSATAAQLRSLSLKTQAFWQQCFCKKDIGLVGSGLPFPNHGCPSGSPTSTMISGCTGGPSNTISVTFEVV